jgi:hypothetical protein
MIAIKADADSEVADEIASTIAATAAESGRAEAYTLAAPFIDSLADDILSRVGEAATVAPDPIAFLKAALARLTHELADPSLLRDIAGLLAARLPDQTKAEQALLEAAALRRERPDDPTALQRVDPDVATAINRILGSPAPPPVARKRRATRSKLSRPKLP